MENRERFEPLLFSEFRCVVSLSSSCKKTPSDAVGQGRSIKVQFSDIFYFFVSLKNFLGIFNLYEYQARPTKRLPFNRASLNGIGR